LDENEKVSLSLDDDDDEVEDVWLIIFH
jgi:hypothetical protein